MMNVWFICLVCADCLLLQFADWFGCFVVAAVFCSGFVNSVVYFNSLSGVLASLYLFSFRLCVVC